MQKGVAAAGELLTEKFGAAGRVWMATLTYRDNVAWQPDHVTSYIKALREWAKRRREEFGYVWVIELTKRGRPHYHLAIWLSSKRRLPKGDSCGWWPHGMTQTVRAHSPVGYLLKYTSKGTENGYAIPKGARLFGCGGLSLADRLKKSWRLLPRYVKEAFNIGDNVARLRGGGWISRATGEFLAGYQLFYHEHFLYAAPPLEDEHGE